MKILVVDDSIAIRAMLTKYLAELGLTDVDQAQDGEVALAMIAKGAYRLILLDWNMPRKSGIEVLKVTRAKGNNVPIMMVTTQAERALVLEAIKAGATDYVFKPFPKDTLQAKVRQILGLRS